MEKNRKLNEAKKSKKAIETEFLIWIIIGIAILVLAVILFAQAKTKGVNLLEYLKTLFRFGVR
jgi:flagellar basal body-associated protein FliL